MWWRCTGRDGGSRTVSLRDQATAGVGVFLDWQYQRHPESDVATWILYAVLVDLTDAVAEALNRPFQALSMEMVYRGLYHFTVAQQRGKADDPIAYLAAEAEGLGIIKRQRKNRGAAADLLYLTIQGKP
jgi:hypothetical protein